MVHDRFILGCTERNAAKLPLELKAAVRKRKKLHRITSEHGWVPNEASPATVPYRPPQEVVAIRDVNCAKGCIQEKLPHPRHQRSWKRHVWIHKDDPVTVRVLYRKLSDELYSWNMSMLKQLCSVASCDFLRAIARPKIHYYDLVAERDGAKTLV